MKNKRHVEQLINEMPQDLAKSYFQMLIDIPESNVEDACKTLRILVGAKRPLTLDEMQHTLATTFDSASIEDMHDNRAWNIDNYLHEILGCMIHVMDDKIHLMHHSLKTFLSKINPTCSEWDDDDDDAKLANVQNLR